MSKKDSLVELLRPLTDEEWEQLREPHPYLDDLLKRELNKPLVIQLPRWPRYR